MAAESEPRARTSGDVDFISVDGRGPVPVERGSDNIFADLGFDDPEEELAKSRLVSVLADILRDRKWTQREAARQMGMSQPAVSRLLRGRTEGVSSDRLLRLITDLGYDVDILVKPAEFEHGKIRTLVAR